MELRNLPEYKELLELKRLKKQTLQEIQEDKAGVRHIGYKVKTACFCTTQASKFAAIIMKSHPESKGFYCKLVNRDKICVPVPY